MAIVGATGSGKTWLERQFIKEYLQWTRGLIPIYIMDTKAQGDFDMFTQPGIGRHIHGNRLIKPFHPKGNNPVMVWTPEFDDHELYEDVLENIYRYHRDNNYFLILIDEISSFMKGQKTPPPAYEKLLKQARGMEGSILTGSQSPSYIPPSFLRMASHMVRMHLNDDYDIKKLSSKMGKKVIDEPRDDYGFWYRYTRQHIKKAPPIYYKNMQEFFGLTS